MKFKLFLIALIIFSTSFSQQISFNYIDSVSELYINETNDKKSSLLKKELISIKAKSHSDFIEGIIHLKKAKTACDKRQIEQSLYLTDKANDLIGNLPTYKKYKLKLYKIISVCQESQGEYTSFHIISDSIISFSKAINDKKSYNEAILNKTNLFIKTEKWDSATNTLSKIYSNELDSTSLIYYLLNYGRIYLNNNHQDSALLCFNKAKNISLLLKDSNNVFYSNNLISSVYAKNLDYNKAIEIQQKMIEYAEKSINYELKITAFNNYATSLMRTKKEDLAITYLIKTSELAKKNNDELSELSAYLNLASFYARKNKLIKAKSYCLKITSSNSKHVNNRLLLTAKYNLGSIEYKLKNYTNSLNYFLSVSNQIDKVNEPKLIQGCYKGLYKSYEKQNQYKKALYFYKKYDSINDHLTEMKLSDKLKQIEVDFEKQKKDDKIKSLQKLISLSNKEKQLQRKTNIALLLLIASTLIISCLIIIMYIRKNNTKKYLIKAISNNIKQIESENIELQEKVKTLSDDTQNKEAIIKHLKENSTKTKGNLLSELILNGLKSNKDWSIFITEFQLNFPEFYEKVNSLSKPKLTKTDLKVISLIKLNLTNNEMALLLNITISGVKKAKQRVNMKFNTNNKSIEEFIHYI